jgi:hypothetical protein
MEDGSFSRTLLAASLSLHPRRNASVAIWSKDELRNLVGVVQKLSVAVNDNIVARTKSPEGAPTRFQRHRYRSPTPPTSYRGLNMYVLHNAPIH